MYNERPAEGEGSHVAVLGEEGPANASLEAEACFPPSGNCKTGVDGIEEAGRRADTNSCKATGPIGCCKAFGLYSSEQRSWWRVPHKDLT